MQIQIKNSGNTGNVPVSLANGELAINFADQILYYKHANGSIIQLANGAQLGVDDYARLRANGAFDTANAAYDKANAAANLSFSTINVAGQSDITADSNNDTLTFSAGPGITITTDAPNDTIVIASTAVQQNAFTTFSVAGQNNVVADSNTDTVTLVAGESINIVTDQANDTITFAVTNIDGGTF
jgi:hypothetical protein